MRKNKTDINFDTLVQKLLGLDPSMLAKLGVTEDSADGAACAGLRMFMRRTLEKSLTLVGPVVAVQQASA